MNRCKRTAKIRQINHLFSLTRGEVVGFNSISGRTIRKLCQQLGLAIRTDRRGWK